MRKEDVFLLNQLLTEMRKLANNLEDALNNRDFESVLRIKKQILSLQFKVGEVA
ncbi:hypothetical protein J4423_04395 [Candidatus Pacearchaeota archaeon]|nr:hypothetical protein [Candidatus Pacearchaeota archaeon]